MGVAEGARIQAISEAPTDLPDVHTRGNSIIGEGPPVFGCAGGGFATADVRDPLIRGVRTDAGRPRIVEG